MLRPGSCRGFSKPAGQREADQEKNPDHADALDERQEQIVLLEMLEHRRNDTQPQSLLSGGVQGLTRSLLEPVKETREIERA